MKEDRLYRYIYVVMVSKFYTNVYYVTYQREKILSYGYDPTKILQLSERNIKHLSEFVINSSERSTSHPVEEIIEEVQ